MPWETLIFLLVGGLAILSALGMVLMINPVHSAIFLVICFVQVAGVFVMLGAEYLAVIQIIVYTGAVLVLLLFVLMLVDIDEKRPAALGMLLDQRVDPSHPVRRGAKAARMVVQHHIRLTFQKLSRAVGRGIVDDDKPFDPSLR